ncbi:ankyrin repeat-containing domain protein [Xylaria longipes]|nr:ankyrin repeat-containing domain protein [Xylaria longipes]
MNIEGPRSQWIEEDEAFNSWNQGRAPAVLNIIGVGSTHISSEIHLAIFDQVLILSFEFDRWDSRRNSEQALLSSCIRQLLTLDPRLYRTIERIANHLVAQSNVACGQLLALFCALLSSTEIHSKVLLIIHRADQCLQPLRSTFDSIITIPSVATSIKILVTTSTPLKLSDRYYELYASKLNISNPIADMVRRRLPQIICHNPDWRNYKESICNKLCADDVTYLQALLNLGALEHGYVPSTKNGITQYLSEKTAQPEEIFETVVGGLSEGGPAILLLNWVFHALRPLTISELAVALTLTPEKQVGGEWEFEMISGELSLKTVRNLIIAMGTIIIIVADEVTLVHYSIRDCFKAHKSLLLPNFHAFATTCCLKYMSTCSSYIGSKPSIKTPAPATAFLEYAMTFWPEHYKLESSPTYVLDDEVYEFLTSRSVHFEYLIGNYCNRFQWPTDTDSKDTLLLAIRLGFRQIILAIDDRDINNPDRRVNVLATAARTSNIEIFRDLHRTVPRNLDLRAVLCAAAEYGQTDIVRLLMRQENDASFSCANNSQETNDPLLLAASNGHAETIEVLLSRGRHIASPEELAQDSKREPRSRTNAVLLAAQTGDFKTLLVLKRLRPDEFEALAGSLDSNGRSPLELCCLSGSPSAFDVLFSVSKPTNEELHKLIYSAAEKVAVENGHYDVVNKLVYEAKRLFESTGDMLWKSELSSGFKACFRDLPDADESGPKQNNNPNYDSRIVTLLACCREISPEFDAIAMKSAVFNGEIGAIDALMKTGYSFQQDDHDHLMRLLKLATAGNRPHVISFFRSLGAKIDTIDLSSRDKYKNVAMDLAIEQDLGLCLHELLLIDPENPWHPQIYADNMIPLLKAVQYGSFISVKVLLHHIPNGWHKTPDILLEALDGGELDVISALLDHGWLTDQLPAWSALDWAIKSAGMPGGHEIVQLLLEKSADPNFKNDKEESPLWVAVKYESEEIIRLLTTYNANPALGHPKYCSALHLAVLKNKESLVAAILGVDKNKNQVDEGIRIDPSLYEALNTAVSSGITPVSFPLTPLLTAVQWQNTKIVRMLLDAGAKLNGGIGLDSPLNAAVRAGAFDLIQYLLQRGADPNNITVVSGGPFHALNSYGARVVRKFGEEQSQSQSESETTELRSSAAAEIGIEVGIEAAAALKAPVRHRGRKKAALIRKIARVLLFNGANIDIADYTGNTPLMCAILHENMQYVEILLEFRPNLNIRDRAGMTAAHYAAFWGSENFMKKLISAGLYLHIVDTLGRTPLYCAGLGVMNDDQDESPTGKFNAIFDALPDGLKRKHAAVALTAVLKAGSKELFQKIIQIEGLDPNVPDRHGWTALDVATELSTLAEVANTLRRMNATRGSMIYQPPPNLVFAIRADHCVPPNKTTYFEVEVMELVSGGDIVIGLSSECSKLTEHIGWRRGTWGYHSDGGSIMTGNEELMKGPPGVCSSTVGVAVDMVSRKACFVFNELWKTPAFDVEGQLYPAISFTWQKGSMSKVAVNFGPEHGGAEFKYRLADDSSSEI